MRPARPITPGEADGVVRRLVDVLSLVEAWR
jgi:hypothetical protein